MDEARRLDKSWEDSAEGAQHTQDLINLREYCFHHGTRGAVEGWYENVLSAGLHDIVIHIRGGVVQQVDVPDELRDEVEIVIQDWDECDDGHWDDQHQAPDFCIKAGLV